MRWKAIEGHTVYFSRLVEYCLPDVALPIHVRRANDLLLVAVLRSRFPFPERIAQCMYDLCSCSASGIALLRTFCNLRRLHRSTGRRPQLPDGRGSASRHALLPGVGSLEYGSLEPDFGSDFASLSQRSHHLYI